MLFLVFRSIGPAELLIIFGIVVVLFGATRIADIGGAFGRSIRAFRREMKEPEGDEEKETANVEGATPEMKEPERDEEKETADVEGATPETKPPQDKGSLKH